MVCFAHYFVFLHSRVMFKEFNVTLLVVMWLLSVLIIPVDVLLIYIYIYPPLCAYFGLPSFLLVPTSFCGCAMRSSSHWEAYLINLFIFIFYFFNVLMTFSHYFF